MQHAQLLNNHGSNAPYLITMHVNDNEIIANAKALRSKLIHGDRAEFREILTHLVALFWGKLFHLTI